ncbi:MAG: hypothetical protein WCG25_03965 [bacterium]
MIIAVSCGIKNLTRKEAEKNTIRPIPVSNKNEIKDQIFDICDALSRFFAQIFCPTSIEIAMESHSAGIMISCKIFQPAQYDATTSVPKLVIKNINTTIPKPREDISREAGNHKKKAFLIYLKSGLKSDQFRCIPYFHLNNIIIQMTAAIH